MTNNQIICGYCHNVKVLSYDNYIDVTSSYCTVCQQITKHFKDITMLKKYEYICQCTKCGKKTVCLMKFPGAEFTKYCSQCNEPLPHTFVPKVVTK